MDLKTPTSEEKKATREAFENIAKLLKNGLFAGANAMPVAMAIDWLDKGVAFMQEPEQEVKPDLKVVPDEQA